MNMLKLQLVNNLHIFFGIILLGCRPTFSDDDDAGLSTMTKLKQDLFKNYDSQTRPVKHHSNTTVVEMNIHPIFVIHLDEMENLLITDVWFLMRWNDDHLKWNPDDYHGLSVLRVGAHDVWKPDLYVYNSYAFNVDPKVDTHVLLYSDGTVLQVPPATITSYCPLDLSNYPNDIQKCSIIVGSWTHDGNAIDLHLTDRTISLDDLYNNNPIWDVKEVTAIREVKYYNCCAEPYVSLRFTFVLQRRYPADLKAIWGPFIVSMLMTLVMFWLPPDSEKKIFLGAFGIIIMTIMVVYLAATTVSPEAIPFAVSPMTSTIYIAISALILEIIVLNLTHLGNTCNPPTILVHIVTGIAGKILCVCGPRPRISTGDRVQLQEDNEHSEKTISVSDQWFLLACALDRFLFLVYSVILIAVHKSP